MRPFVRGFATNAQNSTLRSCAQMQALEGKRMEIQDLTQGKTYYWLTFADPDMTMPGVEPLIYIGHGEKDGLFCFQDTVSFVRFGPATEYQGEEMRSWE